MIYGNFERVVLKFILQVCTLEITDTNGNHEFPAMERLAMMKGHAFILVYSVTCRNSFDSVKNLFNQLKTVRGQLDDTPVMLVGNKVDESKKKMEVSMQEGQSLAQQLGCVFIETSAKHNVNVRETIQQLLQQEKQRNVAWLPINEAISNQQRQQPTTQGGAKNSNDKRCALM